MTAVFTANDDAARSRLAELAQKYHGISIPDEADAPLVQALSKLPVLTKADLIAYAQENQEDHLRTAILFSETSGTTASPLQTPRGIRDLRWNILNQINAYKRYLQPGIDRVAVIHPSVLSPFVEASCLALHELGIGYVRLYPIPEVCTYERILAVLERYRITAMMTTPTLAYKVLYEIQKLGAKTHQLSLKKALLTGELITRESANNMAQILGAGSLVAPFVYGSSETATLMFGTPGCRYLPILEDFIFEIDGQQKEVPDSEQLDPKITGRLLVTWLRDGMLPILRYDTGDIFSVAPGPDHSPSVFEFEGRDTGGHIRMTTKLALDRSIHALPLPIYHYQFRSADDALVIISDASSIDAKSIRKALIDSGGITEKTRVDVNPQTSTFYQFSPSPKASRFT